MKNVKFLQFLTKKNDQIGDLASFSDTEIGYSIRRIYFIYNTHRNISRGYHAHKNLQQILWCPHGNIKIIVDDGFRKLNFELNSPDNALFIGPGIWREMKWLKSNSVLCVAASEHYDEDDYVRDYDKFLKMVNEGYWNEK